MRMDYGKYSSFKEVLRPMKKILILILAVFAGVIIISHIIGKGWIIYREGAFKGKVIDAETKEPIEGAVVVAIYHVRQYGIAESGSSAVDAKEVVTDKNGSFHIPPHTFFHLYPFARGETPEFLIYKPGYTAYSRDTNYFGYFPYSPLNVSLDMKAELFKKGVTIDLMKLRTKEERIENFRISISDFGTNKLPILHEAINEERNKFGFEKVE
jgi:hypothetical protein